MTSEDIEVMMAKHYNRICHEYQPLSHNLSSARSLFHILFTISACSGEEMTLTQGKTSKNV
jgi:hypothetical protein